MLKRIAVKMGRNRAGGGSGLCLGKSAGRYRLMDRAGALLLLTVCLAVWLTPAALCRSYAAEETGRNAADTGDTGEKKTIMVLSPHQDDEANMALSTMYEAGLRGDNVIVVMAFGQVEKPGLNDKGQTVTINAGYGGYADYRNQETLSMMGYLGLPQTHVGKNAALGGISCENPDLKSLNFVFMGYQQQGRTGQFTTAGKIVDSLGEKDITLSDEGVVWDKVNNVPYRIQGDETDLCQSWHWLRTREKTGTGELCPISQENFRNDMIDILTYYKPDVLYIVDQDGHSDHELVSHTAGQALGRIFQDPNYADWRPEIFTSLSYQTAWQQQPDFDTTVSPSDPSRWFLQSLVPFSTPRNPTYTWSERVRFPVPEEMRRRGSTKEETLEKNLAFKAYVRGYAQTVSYDIAARCVNGDRVFWKRDSGSLSYLASVDVTSSPETKDRLHDYQLVNQTYPIRTMRTYDSYAWNPQSSDVQKTATMRFDAPVTLSEVRLYDDYKLNNQITKGELKLYGSSGSVLRTIQVGALNDSGQVNRITFPETQAVKEMTFQIKEWKGTPGLSEWEAYAPREAERTEFIKLYLKAADGKANSYESFLYDYPMQVKGTGASKSIQLGVYRYPNEVETSGYTFEITAEGMGDTQGITLGSDGLLTVSSRAQTGYYLVSVTDQDDTSLKDTFRISLIASGITGDVNEDGKVDLMDIALYFSGRHGFSSWPVDLNGDGVVDKKDLQIIIDHYGYSM